MKTHSQQLDTNITLDLDYKIDHNFEPVFSEEEKKYIIEMVVEELMETDKFKENTILL